MSRQHRHPQLHMVIVSAFQRHLCKIIFYRIQLRLFLFLRQPDPAGYRLLQHLSKNGLAGQLLCLYLFKQQQEIAQAVCIIPADRIIQLFKPHRLIHRMYQKRELLLVFAFL